MGFRGGWGLTFYANWFHIRSAGLDRIFVFLITHNKHIISTYYSMLCALLSSPPPPRTTYFACDPPHQPPNKLLALRGLSRCLSLTETKSESNKTDLHSSLHRISHRDLPHPVFFPHKLLQLPQTLRTLYSHGIHQ